MSSPLPLFDLESASTSQPCDNFACFRHVSISLSEDASLEEISAAFRFRIAFLFWDAFSLVHFLAVVFLGLDLRVVKVAFFDDAMVITRKVEESETWS